MGRTQLQDAVPMTLGQEFNAFATTLGEDLGHLEAQIPRLLCEVNLGGTAIGTGINSDPRYQRLAVERLGAISGQPLVPAKDLIEATSDMGAFVLFSGMLKRLAVKLPRSATTCACSPAARAPVSTRSTCRRASPAARSCRARSIR